MSLYLQKWRLGALDRAVASVTLGDIEYVIVSSTLGAEQQRVEVRGGNAEEARDVAGCL